MSGGLIPQDVALRLQLAALAGNEPASSCLESRWRRPGGTMLQEFWPARAHRAVSERVQALAERGDIYVGAAPRVRKQGTADAVHRCWVLWVDVDQADALERLEAFEPAPSIVLLTGTPGHVLALWPLRTALASERLVQANRRLAHALGADMAATDAARILRVPQTFNHKHTPPAAVECVRLEIAVYAADDVVGELSDPPPKRPASRVSDSLPPSLARQNSADALLTIAPTEYIPMLLGCELGRDGKTSCPFHDDRAPSLHAYTEPGRGWTCYGCQRGGTIIDFGALLYGIEPRGRGFHDIRRRLAADLLSAAGAA